MLHDEEVGGHREDAARLAHARRFPHAMSTTNAIESQSWTANDRRERRRERGDARRDRHRHGEDVVGEQRDARDLRGQQTEVVAR